MSLVTIQEWHKRKTKFVESIVASFRMIIYNSAAGLKNKFKLLVLQFSFSHTLCMHVYTA